MSNSDSFAHLGQVAVVGMAVRLPGAKNIAEFWQNLRTGVESVTFFSDQEMEAEGIPAALINHPKYVKANGVLDNIEMFDAAFFNINRKEAQIIDPQHRFFLECAWEALEDAGYDSARYQGRIGMYASESMNSYFLFNLFSNQEVIQSLGSIQTVLGNDRDFLATRASFNFDLKGPSIVVQSACSSSLVAVHLACQSLTSGECDMALAGGISISLPQKAGYMFQDGGIYSPDGHCRAFDAGAGGTVGGNGVGVVVLKRLDDALADGDMIHAVIKGSAINNDGALKVGYTAPSVEGQARVIAEALAVARIEPSTITYVEAHGTGTQLGDPIEIEALTQAFRHSTDRKSFCAVGSVKTNIGHLDAAAGVAGLIKTVLALSHKVLPPSLHFNQPNPKIDFAHSPFYVNASLSDWQAGSAPRRAGVSSFGIGGTNAHVVLEEAPARKTAAASRSYQLLVLSAKTGPALESATANLLRYLEQPSDSHLADVAYTLQIGRRNFNHARMLVCRTVADGIAALETKKFVTHVRESQEPAVVFMFPGQGTQYVNMGRELYEVEPQYRQEVDHCAHLLEPHLGIDIRQVIYPSAEKAEAADRRLIETSLTQPALFVIEYALAKLLMSWGVRPAAMIGHSLGEYVAACIAEVFSLEDALELVAMRGRMMQLLPGGAMLSVQLPEAEIQPRLSDKLSLAAVNGPALCTVSGSTTAVEALQKELNELGIASRRLRTSHAFHSAMMNEIMDPLARHVKTLSLKPPRIPYVSDLTGKWITAAEAVDASYWSRHLRQPVRFAEGLALLHQKPHTVLLEVGPGHTLSTLARQHPGKFARAAISSLPAAAEQKSDEEYLLGAIGRLWLAGVEIDWRMMQLHEGRLRVSLPTYPFQHQRHWIEPAKPEPPRNSVPRETEDKLSRLAATAGPTDDTYPLTGPAIAAGRAREAEAQMSQIPMTTSETDANGKQRIWSALKSVITELTGADLAEINPAATFFELGVDSLLLIQAAQAIEKRFEVKLSFRQLLEDYPTLDGLANYLEQQTVLATAQTEEPSSPEIPLAREPTGPRRQLAAGFFQHNGNGASQGESEKFVSISDLERVMTEMLQVVTREIDSLRHGGASAESLSTALKAGEQSQTAERAGEQSMKDHAPRDSMAPLPETSAPASGTTREDPQITDEKAPALKMAPEPFTPFHAIKLGPPEGLTPHQQNRLSEFTERYTKRTQKSKELIQSSRVFHADSRLSLNYRQQWKNLVYPIVGARSRGSRLWDADDNEYIDMTMGFGVSLLGHSPAFLVQALEQQIEQGFQLGPQSAVAGEVAQLLCELTGMERAAFCNSGTEGVMAALRLARTATGRHKVAVFAGSYHGSFDGILARGIRENGHLRAVPLSPGVPPSLVADVIVLDYDRPEALETIKAHAHELAAVLVEPVQSRRPDLQPAEFLRALRELTTETGIILIFDEVITGFRLHQGGAQAWFGIRADLAVYGKIIGGGVPIGAVAGKSAIMDAIDGGMWSFTDNSYPMAPQTYFAGTLFKNPLSMAAARAMLQHLKNSGPTLQRELGERTAKLAARFNHLFEESDLDIRVVHCASLFRFNFARDFKFADLFFYYLIHKGIYIWEGRNCFLSTAHTDEDLNSLVRAVEQTVAEMRAAEFLPPAAPHAWHSEITRKQRLAVAAPSANTGASAHTLGEHNGPEVANSAKLFPLTEGQQQVWIASQMGEAASVAYNQSINLHMRGKCNIAALRQAIKKLVERHESLRTTFSPLGDYQQIKSDMRVPAPLLNFSHLAEPQRQAELNGWLAKEVQEPFDLARGPLLRTHIARLEEEYHLLVLTIHHLVIDGWSSGVLLRELREIYSAECQGVECHLPPPESYREFALRLMTSEQSDQMARAEVFWLNQFADTIPVLNLPLDHPRAPVQTFSGNRRHAVINRGISEELKKLSAQQGCTTFVTLLVVFSVVLRQLSSQDDFIVGIHSAGQLTSNAKDLIGYCINLLPFRTRIDDALSFTEYLGQVRRELLDIYSHQNYPFGRLIKQLNPPRDPSRSPLIAVTFNVDRGGQTAKFYGLEVDVVATHNGHSKFDLSVNLIEKTEDIEMEYDYNTDLFESETIRRWMTSFETTLRAVLRNPAIRLKELKETIEEAGRQQQLLDEEKFRESRRQKLKKLKRRAVV
jgi:acyl transferase domain-containing protein/glutamate-1-semialdehyde aminotransferase/non-ribosomal peptide synthetase component F